MNSLLLILILQHRLLIHKQRQVALLREVRKLRKHRRKLHNDKQASGCVYTRHPIHNLDQDHAIDKLREQLAGHPVEPYLQKRKAAVDKHIRTHPDYFPGLVCFFQQNPELQDLISEDEQQQLGNGNCKLALDMEQRLQRLRDETPEAKDYFCLAQSLETDQKALHKLRAQIDDFVTAAKQDWTGPQGQDPRTFTLESFIEAGWSADKLASFSKKEMRANDPKTILRIRDQVIPGKLASIAKTHAELATSKKAYTSTATYSLLEDYLVLRDDGLPETESMYEATLEVDRHMHLGGNSDGGFEQNILLDPKLKEQWYPGLIKLLEARGLETCNIGILTGHYWVVKHQRHSKTWYRPVETDLVLFDEKTKRILAVGEVKSNPSDLGHADYQLTRNEVMMTGIAPWDDPRFDEYLACHEQQPEASTQDPSNTIVDRYLVSNQHKLKKPHIKVLTSSDYANPARFIITQAEVNCPGRLRVSSKIVTRVANWLFSSSQTPEAYIQAKVDALQEELGLREREVVCAENHVFVVQPSAED